PSDAVQPRPGESQRLRHTVAQPLAHLRNLATPAVPPRPPARGGVVSGVFRRPLLLGGAPERLRGHAREELLRRLYLRRAQLAVAARIPVPGLRFDPSD